MKSPEVLQNCSTGFQFPYQPDETIQVGTKPFYLETAPVSCMYVVLNFINLIAGKCEASQVAAFLWSFCIESTFKFVGWNNRHPACAEAYSR